MSESTRRHIFISHHHADDAEVTKLTELLGRHNVNIRNSSIRAKPANQERLDKGLVKPETIRRLLRMKISWASTVVVLVGNNTASRPWVNWEVEEANRQGKRIVGVFARGATNADIPPTFEKYGSALVGWHADSIIGAVDGGNNVFQNPDGSTRAPANTGKNVNC
ncbi:MAG: TIR domain-containing protein [Kiritimatiellia bacterium]